MSAWLLLLLIAALIAGVLLIWFGLRGRRMNRDPVCRDCGFNLSSMRLPEIHGIAAPALGGEGGEMPVAVTCPECGGGLKRAKALRIGERKKMPMLVVVGVVTMAATISTVVFPAMNLLVGKSVTKQLPTGMLLLLANGESKDIAAELEARITAKSLSVDQLERVVERTLELQADWQRPWNAAWGEVFDAAVAAGAVKTDQKTRWMENAVAFRAKVRAEVNPGDPLVLRIQRDGERLSSRSAVNNTIALESLELDGVDVGAQVHTGSARRQNVYFHTSGAGRMNESRISEDLFAFLPKMPPGKHSFRITLLVQLAAGGGPPIPGSKGRRVVVSGDLVVRSDDQPTVRPAPSNPTDSSSVRSYLSLPEVGFALMGWSTDSEGVITPNIWRLVTEFPWDQQPRVPLAMQVLLIDANGQEWSIGKVFSDSYEEDGLGIAGTTVRTETTLSASADIKGPVMLVFRPDIRLAKETFGLQEYFAEEIRLENLPIWWSPEYGGKPRFERAVDAVNAKQMKNGKK
jgi:hypothetical protein